MLCQVDSVWFVVPTCLAGVHEELHGCSRFLVYGAGLIHPFTWINVQGLATVHQGLGDGSTHRSIVPVGVLSSMFSATVSCADSFCLPLRDRECLIGLGMNDPPGVS